MSLLEAIGKRVLIRRLERIRKDLERKDKMPTLSPGFKVALMGLILLLLQAGLDATRSYFDVDLTPTFGEWGRSVIVAMIGSLLYWLRSPRDQPPAE